MATLLHPLQVLLILVVIWLLIPPDYDPAIRLKEWLEDDNDG